MIENLPVELVGVCILGYLSLKDIVMLERACGSKKSHQLFLTMIPLCTDVVLSHSKHTYISALDWFAKRRCKISSLEIWLPGYNPCFHVKNLQVDYFELQICSYTTIENIKPLLASNIGYKVRIIEINGNQNMEAMELLSACTRNIQQLTIKYANNCIDWLISEIKQTYLELTSIALSSDFIDDSDVVAIAQHCPKLETLLLRSNYITCISLLALSERGLPLKELQILYIPIIPTTDIARRCSHALSCIRHLNSVSLHRNNQDATILIPYMTGLSSVDLNNYAHSCISLLTQHCCILTKITWLLVVDCSITSILSLCRANPLLQELSYYACDLTDTLLIELIHTCPHLNTLDLSYETDITDTGILALSEHCPQLQELTINKCHKVTEAAVLQLLQRCHKLTRLVISSSSLSKETWTQLDKNTQKRVRR